MLYDKAFANVCCCCDDHRSYARALTQAIGALYSVESQLDEILTGHAMPTEPESVNSI